MTAVLHRWLRHLGVASVVAAAAYVAKRVVDERRDALRLAAPITAWPEVLVDQTG